MNLICIVFGHQEVTLVDSYEKIVSCPRGNKLLSWQIYKAPWLVYGPEYIMI
ncbi:hypothetical protein GCM10011389_01110 [Pontibacillus salipaludis]|uniref:Uncharacterized protein n=1 Tax=Pontibacillus salipaludis TaxID=1697394 RepID=A0ABQ1PIG8_9BACI|nr:hypothetical protein GCM10011389_01110 [Pontibacillus salipaludis]